STGRITWIPQPGQLGSYVVDVRASDGLAETKHNLVIESVATPRLPEVRIVTTPSFPALPGQTIRVDVIADGVAPIESLSLTYDGGEVTLNEQGRAEIIAGSPGKTSLVAIATDVDGFFATVTETVRVRTATDKEAPQVALSLDGSQRITEPTELIAAINDVNLDQWSLEIAAHGSDDLETLASGQSTGEDLALATLDPASLANGFYTIRLTASDISGRSSKTSVDVEVNSDSKTDAFTRTDVDAEITFGDQTFQIARQYDSLRKSWRFTFRNVALQTFSELADASSAVVHPALSGGDRVYLSLPDGRRVGFTFEPQRVQLFPSDDSLVFYKLHWTADAGVDYELRSIDRLLVRGGERYFDQATGQPYHPANFISVDDAYELVHPDGRVDRIDAAGRITRQQWPGGEIVQISDSGILLPSGEFLAIVHNAQGQIASLRTPTMDLHYRYDDAGRLVEVASVSDVAQSLHRYGYESETGETLSVAVSVDGNHRAYPADQPLTADLGRAADFSASPIIGELDAGQTDQYAFTIDDAQLRSTDQHVVWVRAIIERYRSPFIADTPRIAGLDPIARSVDGDRTVALFSIQRADQYLLSVAGASADDAGRYRLHLDVVGDINRDGVVDGLDSMALANSMGSFIGDRTYDPAADFNADGAITIADSQLLAANFGFTSDFAALAWDDRFVTVADFPTITPPPGAPSQPPIDPPVDPSTGDDTRITPTPELPPSVDPPTFTPTSLAPTAGATFDIRNGWFDADGEAWTTTGNVDFDNGAAELSESPTERTSLRQAFYVPDGASILRLTISNLSLTADPDRAPDALEIALLDANTFTPLVGVIPLGQTDASLNFATDGTYRSGAGVTVGDTRSSDPSQDLRGVFTDGTMLVQIDVSAVPAGTLAVLSIDLIGFAQPNSHARIDDVFLVSEGLRAPIARTDLAATEEDVPVNLDVLANDSDHESPLVPASLTLVTPPEHGQVFVSPQSGIVTYSPDPDYSGNDSFTYTVKDVDGYVSNEAFVSINVTPITDTPSLVVHTARGDQDQPLPLQIDAMATDADDSERLTVTIASLPQGATLNQGVRIADGQYRLALEDLDGLQLMPSAGWSGQAMLDVTVTATDPSADPVSAEEQLRVDVGSVFVNPMSISGFDVNAGEIQRSQLHTLTVTFNQHAWIADASADIFVSNIEGDEIRIPSEKFSYDPDTFTLTIDVNGLIQQDDQYYLMLRNAGIASNANRLQTMASGPEFGSEFLPLPFHRLLGDVNGNNEVDTDDWRDIRISLNSNAESPRYARHRDLTGEGMIDRHDFVVWRNRLGSTTDQDPPQILAGVTLGNNRLPLVNAFRTDAELSLVVDDVSEVASLTVSVDGSPTIELVDRLSSEDALQLPLTELYSIAGQTLAPDDQTLTFVAVDRYGNASKPVDVEFVIDESAPAIPSTPALLDADGNVTSTLTVADPRVVIRSIGETGSIVRLYRDGREVGLGIAQSPVDFPLNLGSLGDGTFSF
ncbi:Ig-like domain-containing protein, partial [Stieleria sp.]|uniref:Ig-like domain-containing protein n=1 Tax=Stieleria sp. TaxID=2795976 RepID=UPI00356496CD